MNVQGFSSASLSTIHSFQSFHASPVGEESADDLNSTVKPIEQSPESIQLSARAETELKRGAVEQKLQSQERIEQEEIKQLAARDREVRQHEQAHAAVGGPYAGAPRYEYQRGPDGVSYAIGGEVSISTSPINGDPEMTIEKAQIIQRAALAPAEPSTQDRKVAAEAVQMEMEARVELMVLKRDEKLQEQKSEDQAMKETGNDSNAVTNVSHSSGPVIERQISLDSDPVDEMNQAQEDIFNEINQNLAGQLVSLGGAQQAPQSLGSIVSRFA